MKHSSWVRASIVAGLVVSAALPGEAQQPNTDRWAVQVALAAGTMLDFARAWCGQEVTPAWGGGISILRRLPHRFVVIADTRVGGKIEVYGCKTTVPGPRQIGPNEYEHLPVNAYPNGIPEQPFTRTALRIGVETSPSQPPARITAGGGLFWRSSRAPFATLGLETGTRGDGARFRIGWETSRAWIRVHSTYARFRLNDLSAPTPLPTREESRVDVRGWTQLHLGVEFPLR